MLVWSALIAALLWIGGCATGDDSGAIRSDTHADADADADTQGDSSGGGMDTASGVDTTSGGMDTSSSGGMDTSSGGGMDTASCVMDTTNGGMDTTSGMDTAPACDESATRTVGCGLCQTEVQTCTGGQWEVTEACSGTQGTTEVCDFIDNDCNGVVDMPACMVGAYEYIEAGGERAYRTFAEGGGTEVFRLYAPANGENPNPDFLAPLHIAYDDPTNDTLLVTFSHLVQEGLTDKGLIGYCVLNEGDIPDEGETPVLFQDMFFLRRHRKRTFNPNFLDTAYRLCAVDQTGCDNLELLSEGYDPDSAPPQEMDRSQLIPCHVFAP